jgi:lysophospholipid acyltransferase (LPLAT)-like uncharacterized protein
MGTIKLDKRRRIMKLRHPLLIKGVGLAGAWLIRAWMNTLVVRMDVRASGHHPADPRQERFLYLFWHETLLFATLFRTKVHVLSSQHADGELMAQICRHLRIGVVRGSTTRGGVGGLWDLLAAAKKTHLAITPDGPKGPRRRVQPGAIFLASQTGLPIVPFGIGYAQAWRARTWDGFAVPYPYSLATSVGAAPIHVPPDLRLNDLVYYRNLVEEQLLKATEEAERWAQGLPRRGLASASGLHAAA